MAPSLPFPMGKASFQFSAGSLYHSVNSGSEGTNSSSCVQAKKNTGNKNPKQSKKEQIDLFMAVTDLGGGEKAR
jgi:hypothetical protein